MLPAESLADFQATFRDTGETPMILFAQSQRTQLSLTRRLFCWVGAITQGEPWAGLGFLGHFGPRIENIQTPSGLRTLNACRHFVPGYCRAVPPGQKPFAQIEALRIS